MNRLNLEKGTILVVDDEPAMRTALREVLKRGGWGVELVEGGEQAMAWLSEGHDVQLVLTDYRMEGMTGLDFLRAARQLRPGLPAIMMTAYGTVEDAVQAMKEGAGDYLLKPFSFEAVLEAVDRVVNAAPVDVQENVPEEMNVDSKGFESVEGDLIAHSPALRHVLEIAHEVADAEATVLLHGESGTGKEVIARFIHERSGRSGPFVATNCAALPEGLLESEMFGHEKGAFTGAVLARKGRFEQANHGTLLLDEISEMPLALQAKLLRVLQEKEVVPVGGSDPIKLNVRVIATSNRQIEKSVEQGDFRQDLYYRLNVISLPIPPLRERPEDIEPLAQYFLGKYHRPGRPPQHLGDEAVQWLRGYGWPGNVRELENMIERACLLARGETIRREDLHLNGSATASTRASIDAIPSDPITLEEMERRLIRRTLDQTRGNRTRTADLLGVSVRTIRNKINQYGLIEINANATDG